MNTSSIMEMVSRPNYPSMTCEMDCKKVTYDLYDKQLDGSEYEHLITRLRSIISTHNDYKVVFMKQSTNRTTHCLARASINHDPRKPYSFIMGRN